MMMTEEEYKKELIRMFDSLRKDHKGVEECDGVLCSDCPFGSMKEDRCAYPFYVVEAYNIVEKWSKEHPPKHYVSQLEYDILCTALDYEFVTFDYWLGDLVKKGYFEGATFDTNIADYFSNCEVKGGNE